MRRYRIEVGSGGTVYDSTGDPNALDVQFDIFAFNYGTAAGGGLDVRSFARIYGVPLTTVAQATNLNGQQVAVYGGMAAGLPLASAAASQFGLLAKGTIYPAFGNWIGNETSLDLILAPPSGSSFAPANVTTNWRKGQELGDALKAALGAAFPKATLNVNVTSGLTLQYDQPFVYETIQQLAQFARTVSQKIKGDKTYMGVQITNNGNAINVYDGTSTSGSSTKQIAFQDMIGQPTWLGLSVNLKTVMRGDVNVGDMITLPLAIPINTPNAALLPQNSVSFAGTYMVNQVRHVGRFRQPTAEAWVTVIDAVSVPGSKSTQQFGGPGFGAFD